MIREDIAYILYTNTENIDGEQGALKVADEILKLPEMQAIQVQAPVIQNFAKVNEVIDSMISENELKYNKTKVQNGYFAYGMAMAILRELKEKLSKITV